MQKDPGHTDRVQPGGISERVRAQGVKVKGAMTYRPHDGRLPVEEVVSNGPRAACGGRIFREVHKLLVYALRRSHAARCCCDSTSAQQRDRRGSVCWGEGLGTGGSSRGGVGESISLQAPPRRPPLPRVGAVCRASGMTCRGAQQEK